MKCMKILSLNKQFSAVKLEGKEETNFLKDYIQEKKALIFNYDIIVCYASLIEIFTLIETYPQEFDKIFKRGDNYPNHNRFEGENISDENWCKEIGGCNRAIKIMSDEKYTFRKKSYYSDVKDCIKSVFSHLSALNILIIRK
jgi:hypothetical protein